VGNEDFQNVRDRIGRLLSLRRWWRDHRQEGGAFYFWSGKKKFVNLQITVQFLFLHFDSFWIALFIFTSI